MCTSNKIEPGPKQELKSGTLMWDMAILTSSLTTKPNTQTSIILYTEKSTLFYGQVARPLTIKQNPELLTNS